MNKIRQLVIIVAIYGGSVFFKSTFADDVLIENEQSGCDCEILPHETIDLLSKQASAGDVQSVKRLVEYYRQLNRSGDDNSLYEHWMEVSAKQEDAQEQWNLAFWFLIQKYPRNNTIDCKNGIYWLKMAASKNLEVAKNPSIGMWEAILSCDWELPTEKNNIN
jgi:hypothetical protein